MWCKIVLFHQSGWRGNGGGGGGVGGVMGGGLEG